MKRKIVHWILILALLLSLCSIPVLAADGSKIAAQSRSGVVRVLALRPDGYISLGSAFGVGDAGKETTIFVTNRHVLYDTYELEDGTIADLPAVRVWLMKTDSAWDPVTGLDNTQLVSCEILHVTDGYPDMAILEAIETIPGRVALPLQKNEKTLDAGDSVYALGYPGSSDLSEQPVYGDVGDKWLAAVEDVTITNGIVSRFTTSTRWGDTKIIQHSAQINHGNSGGPLIDERGAVVGINTYGSGRDLSTGDDNSYYSIRISYVKDALDDLHIHYDVSGGPGAWLYVLIGVLVLAAAAGAVLVLRKKKVPQFAFAGRRGSSQSADSQSAGQSSAVPGDTGLRIQGLSGVYANRRFAIAGTLRVGRDPASNDLVYPADTQGVSGVHCVLFVEGGQLYLKDLGSTYGTFLAGGQRLAAGQAAAVNVGAQFWLGSEREKFVVSSKGGV